MITVIKLQKVTQLGRCLYNASIIFRDLFPGMIFLTFFPETVPICYKSHVNMCSDEIFCSADQNYS